MVDPKSIFDSLPDQTEEARLDALAYAEIEAGNGTSHQQVRAWLLKRGAGEKVPPPDRL